MQKNRELQTRLQAAEEALRSFRALEKNHPIHLPLLESLPEGVAMLDYNGSVVFSNERLSMLLETKSENLCSSSFFRWVVKSDQREFENLLREGSKGRSQRLLTLQTANEKPLSAYLSVNPLHGADEERISLVITDIRDESIRGEKLRIVRALALAVGQAPSVNAALQQCLEMIGEAASWPYGEAWLPAGSTLELALASHAVREEFKNLRLHQGTLLAPGVGLAGRCWAAQEPLWVNDVSEIPTLSDRQAWKDSGLTSAVAIPVMAMDRVVVVLAFAMKSDPAHDEQRIRAVSNAGIDLAPLIVRKLSDEEKVRQQAQLGEVQRLAHLGSIEWDVQEDRISASAEMEHILGARAGNLDGSLESFLQRVCVEDRVAAEDALQGTLRDFRPFKKVLRLVAEDGSLRWIEAAGRVFLGHNGAPENVVLICLDITQRVAVEEELRARETKLKLILRQMPAVVWTTDLALNYTSLQGTAAFGREDEAIGQVGNPGLPALGGRLTPEQESAFKAHTVALGGQTATYEFKVNDRTLEAHVEPMRGVDGNIAGCIGVTLDITERKAHEERLLNSRDELEREIRDRTADLERARGRIETVLDGITDNYFLLDSDNRFGDINTHALKYFGKKKDEVIGRQLSEVLPEMRNTDFGKTLEIVADSRRPVHLESETGVPDRWAFWHLHPVDEGVAVYFADISGRKKAEQELRSSEERFRTMLDNARDVLYRRDLRSGTYDYISPSSIRILGFTQSELMAMTDDTILECVEPEDRVMFMEWFFTVQESAEENLYESVEYRWKHPHGDYRWISASRNVVRDAEGKPIAIVATLRDITDRRHFVDELTRANNELHSEIERRREIQRALQSSELRYRAIVEDQVDLICRFGDDGTMTFVNEAFCTLFQKKREDLLGQANLPLFQMDDAESVRGKLAMLNPGNPSVTIENHVTLPNGETRWLQWNVRMLYDSSGGKPEYQAAGRDITERKQAENLLAIQYEITLALAESTTTSDAMRRALQVLCERLGWDLAILWRTEKPTTALRFEGIWCAPGVESVVLEHSLIPEMDLPGRIVREREPIWIPAIEQATGIQSQTGFVSVLAFPVRAGGDVTAVIGCFSRRPRPPQKDVLDTVETVGHQIGNFRERKNAEESLRHAAENLEIRVRQRTEQLAGALEALSNSEMRFRAMFESAPLGIALVNTAGMITERNPTLERMLGYPDGSLYGIQFESLVQPADRYLAVQYFHDMEEGQHIDQRVEVRFIHKEGGAVWGSVNSSVMSFEGNESPFIIVMIKEITERKLMEEELRQSENRFRTMFNESPIGIALLDARNVYVQTNGAMHDMLGYGPGELVGRALGDTMRSDVRHENEKKLEKVIKGKLHRFQTEQRFVRKDGSGAWGNMNAAAIRSANGDFLYSLLLVEDITARKNAEQQIHMLAHTITSMNEIVVIMGTDSRVLSVNKAFLRSFNYEEPEILGRDIKFLGGSGPGAEDWAPIIEGTLQGGWTGEIEVARKGGEMFPILLSTSVVREERGSPIALVGIARDITEQRRLQHQLDDAERRRSEDLRRFAINVQRAQEEERQRISRELHDDICQRLSGMKLNMEVLEDDVRVTDRKVYRALRGFRKQFEETISEVRRLSSNLRPTVLDDFGLAIAINLLSREFSKNQKTKVKVETGDPSLRHLDPQVEIALYRIAQESLANIAKHAKASLVSITMNQPGNVVELKIEDNGGGFDELEARHAREEGHGMGLINMKERAELLGGRCSIESVKGLGTIIQVSIPLEVRSTDEEN